MKFTAFSFCSTRASWRFIILLLAAIAGGSSCSKDDNVDNSNGSSIAHEMYIYNVIANTTTKIPRILPDCPFLFCSFTPDSKKIMASIVLNSLFLMNTDGSMATALFYKSEGGYLIVSPDCNHVAYIVPKGLGIMDTTGHNMRTLIKVDSTQTTQTLFGIEWSPDSKKIACKSMARTYIAATDGKFVSAILDDYIYEYSWSFDSQSIAYIKSGKLYSYSISTKQSQLVVSDSREFTRVSCSPNSKELIAVCNDGYTYSVVRMNADGTNQRTILQNKYIGEIKWSPDGSRFSCLLNWTVDLAIVSIDGRNSRIIANSGNSYMSFVWSPDGNNFMFAVNKSNC